MSGIRKHEIGPHVCAYVKIHRYTFIKKRIITTNLDDFTGDNPSSPRDVNIPDVSISPRGELDILFYNNPVCPLCLSSNVSRNGTFVRTLESGQPIIIQKYICNECDNSFDARPPNYGYGNHFSDDIKKKSVRGRVRTSLRNVRSFFHDLMNVRISHETVRKSMPDVPDSRFESSGYFVYDEQYSHVNGKERYRTLLKDTETGTFIEGIVDDLSDDSIAIFLMNALSHFNIPETVTITTDGYHYGNVLKSVSRNMGIRIRRQRCLFHIEKDLSHRIKMAHRENDLDLPKRLIKYMFFQTPENLRKIGKDSISFQRSIEGKSESEIIDHTIALLNRYYGDDPIIYRFLTFLEEYREEVFLYLKDKKVEKTTGIAERHFSVMSWLLKHRFKTRDGLLKMSYWHHYYHPLSTRI